MTEQETIDMLYLLAADIEMGIRRVPGDVDLCHMYSSVADTLSEAGRFDILGTEMWDILRFCARMVHDVGLDNCDSGISKVISAVNTYYEAW